MLLKVKLRPYLPNKLAEDEGEKFDSVRVAFWEGEALYEGAGVRSVNHIQLAILNLNYIKGVFYREKKLVHVKTKHTAPANNTYT